MPSQPSALLKLELQQTGENLNAWGDKLNGLFTAVEQAVGSVYTLTITGDRVLSADNYVPNEYRRCALILTGTPAADFTITVPPVSYPYLFVNRTGRQATIKTASGVSALVRAAAITPVLCDGTDCTVIDPTLDQIKTATGPVSFGGQRQINVGPSQSDTDGINRGEVSGLTAAGVQLANDWAQKTSGSVDGGSGYSARLWATSTTVLAGGFKGALGYANDAAASASAANTSAGNASTSATNAANSATQAAQSAASLTGTSTTSQTLGAGSKTFTTQTGKFFGVNTRLLITSDANPANYMFGNVTAYSGTSLTVNVLSFGGVGSASDWTIRVSGERGPIGPASPAPQPIVPKAAAYTFAAADLGSLFNCSGGPYTLTASPSVVGATWWVDIKNTLPGILTFTPSSGTVDGLPSIKIYGETFRLLSDGTNFYTANRQRRVLVGITTVASPIASVSYTGLPDLDLNDYELQYNGLVASADGTTTITVSQGGAFLTAGYAFSSISNGSSGTAQGATQTNNSYFDLQMPNGGSLAAAKRSGLVRISGLNLGSSGFSLLGSTLSTVTGASAYGFSTFGWLPSAANSPIDGIRIAPGTGNFTAGVVKLYGLRG